MTTVEIRFEFAVEPTPDDLFALGKLRDVYGIRRLDFDPDARTVTVEYDATRLNSATVANLLRNAGLDVAEVAPAVVEQPAPSEAR